MYCVLILPELSVTFHGGLSDIDVMLCCAGTCWNAAGGLKGPRG